MAEETEEKKVIFRIPLDTFMTCWLAAFQGREEPQTLQEMTASLSDRCNKLEVNKEWVKENGPKVIPTSTVSAKMNYYIKNWEVKLMKPKSKAGGERAKAKKVWIDLFESANLIDD